MDVDDLLSLGNKALGSSLNRQRRLVSNLQSILSKSFELALSLLGLRHVLGDLSSLLETSLEEHNWDVMCSIL